MTAQPSPRQQLTGFISKYEPSLARQARQVLAALQSLCPGALQVVYDNYNALAIGFASGEKMRDIWFSIVLYPRWISLFFFNTLPLRDPSKRLKGSGRTTRHIVLIKGAATLKEPDVKALIVQAMRKASHPFPGGRGKIIIRSVSARQRPRRPK